jgi:hypothetical protein
LAGIAVVLCTLSRSVADGKQSNQARS